MDGTEAPARRRVYVTPSMIAAAQAQVEISRQLGRDVPKVVQKIAQATMEPID